MKRVVPDDSWPASWKYSYAYDLEEIYGQHKFLGYAYAYEKRRAVTLDLLTEVLPLGARVLDIAAAQGNMSIAMVEKGYDVTWNDLREDLCDYVKLKNDSESLSFAAGNAFDLAFPFLFDAVLITEIIEHVAHPDEFLLNTARLVKPGGYIIMTTPNGEYFKNSLPKFSQCVDPSQFEAIQFGPNSDDHIFLLHRDEVENLAYLADLQIDRMMLFNNPFTSGHLKLEFILKFVPNAFVFAI